MPRNECQTERALGAAASPCVTCAERDRCPVQSLHRQVQLAQVRSPVNRRSIVSACSGYVPPGTNQRVRLDIVESLDAEGVRDLCDGCPEPAEDGCETHDALGGLKDLAKRAHGIDVSFTTVCCSVKRGLVAASPL
jgi:hypothetical protein